MKTAIYLYAILAAALLILAGWLIEKIVTKGIDVDMVAFLTVIFMAFRDVISKMGDTVRGMNGDVASGKVDDPVHVTPEPEV